MVMPNLKKTSASATKLSERSARARSWRRYRTALDHPLDEYAAFPARSWNK